MDNSKIENQNRTVKCKILPNLFVSEASYFGQQAFRLTDALRGFNFSVR